jgi:ankyrin repeat protein
MSLFDAFLPINVRLLKAVEKGDVELVKQWINLGADVNMMNRRGETALARAYVKGYIGIARELIVHEAEIEEKFGLAMLMKEVEKGNLEMVRLLTDHGVDTNSAGKTGITPLMLACALGNLDTTRLLIEKNAEVNAADHDGTNALIAAADKGHADIVSLLIEKGADVNAGNKDGIRALHRALKHEHADIAEMLKSAGAVE